MRIGTGEPAQAGTSQQAPAVGVLLVHGIGQQARGDTLLRFGQPIVYWLDGWLSGAALSLFAKRVNGRDIGQWFVDRVFPQVENDRALELRVAALVARLGDHPDIPTSTAPGDPAKVQALIDEAQAALAQQLAADGDTTPIDKARFVVTGSYTVEDAHLNGAPGDVTAPPHAAGTLLTVGGDGSLQAQRWLFAESWWAESFLPTEFWAVLDWTVRIGPYVGCLHLGTQVRRAWVTARRRPVAGARDLLFATAGFLFGLVALQLLMVAMLVLATLAMVPIAPWRRTLARVQGTMVAILGDSHALVRSMLRESLMTSRVARDLAWLREKGCRKVVLFAHSQGAGICFRMLKRHVPDLDLFVTVGSGLRKLEELTYLESIGNYGPGRAFLGWMALAGAAALEAVLFGLVPSGFMRDAAVAGGVSFILIGGAACVLVNGEQVAYRWIEKVQDLGRFVWRDWYASHDPVPNGPLVEDDAPPLPIDLESIEVNNCASFVSDHNAYWYNRDEFIPAVTWEIARVAGFALHAVRAGDAALLERAFARRRIRTKLLGAARVTLLLSVVALLWVLSGTLTEMGEGVRSWIKASLGYELELGPFLVGAAVHALPALLAYISVRALWAEWCDDAADGVLERRDGAVFWTPYLMLLLIAACVALPIVWAFPALDPRWVGAAGIVISWFGALYIGRYPSR
jgi:hypothetical protein